MLDRSIHPKRLTPSTRLCVAILTLTMLVAGARAAAAEDQSYRALMDWFDHYREAPATFAPGQTLDGERPPSA